MIRKFSRRGRQSKAPRRSFLGGFLDPIDLLSTTFFSVLFALLFTLTHSVLIFGGFLDSSFSNGYGLDLFITILGAVTAWGIIDGIMYALIEVFQRGERHRLLQQLQAANSDELAIEVIADEFDFILEPITNGELRQSLYLDIRDHLRKGKPKAVGLEREDVISALASVLVSLLAVLPSLMPLLLLPQNIVLAIRISNFVSFGVLFVAGYSWGKHTNTSPWKTGLLMAAVGLIMVLVALLLGG